MSFMHFWMRSSRSSSKRLSLRSIFASLRRFLSRSCLARSSCSFACASSSSSGLSRGLVGSMPTLRMASKIASWASRFEAFGFSPSAPERPTVSGEPFAPAPSTLETSSPSGVPSPSTSAVKASRDSGSMDAQSLCKSSMPTSICNSPTTLRNLALRFFAACLCASRASFSLRLSSSRSAFSSASLRSCSSLEICSFCSCSSSGCSGCCFWPFRRTSSKRGSCFHANSTNLVIRIPSWTSNFFRMLVFCLCLSRRSLRSQS
mmetsp:Transcript_28796/g.85718  ORF Transcript_28796/g.85718 Transcript_28796/m.85718 type:complete len:261 (-) Transcript_28796:226-1008(-)